MRLWIQVTASYALVAVVLWFMWRLPRRGESWFGIAPVMALSSAWLGLVAVATSVLLWWVAMPDWLLAMVLLLLDPGALALGVLVLWVYRGEETARPAIEQQRLQAKTGVALGLFAVVVGYVFVITHKPLFTPVGM